MNKIRKYIPKIVILDTAIYIWIFVMLHLILQCFGLKFREWVYKGKEDHVWMDMEPFEEYQVGDCLSFGGEIYRYLKTKNGKQISFGIREPYDIKKIESYELPSDDDMLMQAVDQMICEVCMFNEHCYMGMCIANEEWREGMRKTLFNAAKGNK